MPRINPIQFANGCLRHVCLRCTRTLLQQGFSHSRKVHTSGDAPQRGALSLLEERGYINQIAGDRRALDRLLNSRRTAFYAGIDPTAPSLHLGHLLPLMVLFWLYHHGHHTVSLVGGATAKVGDPSGRLFSRVATAESVTESNFASMFAQLGRLWESAISYGNRHGHRSEDAGQKELLNNAQWLDNLNVLDFLKTMGNGMRLGALLGRDTVKNKMEKGDGMSFSEFTYPLLQAWDWWQMYQDRGVQVQIGGSDQYGNIVAGIDAVKYIAQSQPSLGENHEWLDNDGRLKDDRSPMGLTVPLLTTSSGEKFGKSAGNAIWLDPSLTSPFDLYGFLLGSTDTDVERYLRLFTFVPMTQIAAVMEEHQADPGKRKAQHLLASEVLELVHGLQVATKTRGEHQAMRAPTLASLVSSKTEDSLVSSAEPTASSVAQRTSLPQSLVYNTPFSRILYHAGLVSTKSEGARLIAKGGVYVASRPEGAEESHESKLNFVSIKDQDPTSVEKFIINGHLILRLGKWKVRVIEVTASEGFVNDNPQQTYP